jgi:hypothetical protein
MSANGTPRADAQPGEVWEALESAVNADDGRKVSEPLRWILDHPRTIDSPRRLLLFCGALQLCFRDFSRGLLLPLWQRRFREPFQGLARQDARGFQVALDRARALSLKSPHPCPAVGSNPPDYGAASDRLDAIILWCRAQAKGSENGAPLKGRPGRREQNNAWVDFYRGCLSQKPDITRKEAFEAFRHSYPDHPIHNNEDPLEAARKALGNARNGEKKKRNQ